jgi:hypothetical protein
VQCTALHPLGRDSLAAEELRCSGEERRGEERRAAERRGEDRGEEERL